MARAALYYPYVHLRDLDWLKGTLLLFERVHRLVPGSGAQPGDDEALKPFISDTEGRPLVTGANLFSPRATSAQLHLAQRLEQDLHNPAFAEQYGLAETLAQRNQAGYGFQVRLDKLDTSLKSVLAKGLAWRPSIPEPYDPGSDQYAQMHPSVGEAVMATLALAVAQTDGLDIVGDARSGPLHPSLLRHEADKIYDAWLHPGLMSPPEHATGEQVFEVFIRMRGNVQNLTAEQLRHLGADREPIQRLRARLAEVAKAKTVAQDQGPGQAKELQALVADIWKEWQADALNAKHFWRKFCGDDIFKPAQTLVEKSVEKAMHFTPGAAVGLGAGAAAGHSLTAYCAIAATFGIGIVVHALKSYRDMSRIAAGSPYAYLTVLEDAGLLVKGG